ncbi:MAG: transglutaminase-like domain-containing protein [Acidobacteriota bacterium]
MTTRKHWIGLAIVAVWLAATALLIEREFGGQRLELTGETPAGTSSTWLGLYLADGPRVGHVHLRRQEESRSEQPGTRLTLDLQMAMQLLGRETDLTVSGVLWRSADGQSAELDVTVDSSEQTVRLVGALADGQLVAEVESGGQSFPFEVPLEADVLLQSGGLGAAVGLPVLAVGDDIRLPSFDPITLSRGTARIRCVREETLEIAGRQVRARRLEVEASGLNSTAWIDLEGEVVRAETPVGLVLERIDPSALATSEAAGGAAAGGGDFLARTAIRPTGERPFRGARRLEARLSMAEGPLPPVPSGGAQRFAAGGRLTVDARPGALTASEQPPTDLLAADAFVQSDHPLLRQQAAGIVGDLEDPRAQAEALYEWVFTEIEKVPVMSLPSALEVLETRRGDCNEHTVLFAALARAVGLPTRIAVGLVWSEDLAGFYYHAWPEVLIGEVFVRLDPTLGQPVADATHIKLLEGGIESWPRLLPYLGRLQIEILEIE